MVFESLGKELKKWLYEHKEYLEPTLAQDMAVPLIMKGKNVLISAPTGYGKTLAAILPLFNDMIKKKLNEQKGIQLLYICPLKSLNRDIFKRVVELGTHVWIETDIRHGDTSQRMRTLQSKMPPHCMITTPETLQAMLCGKNLRNHLSNVKYVIIDEIHEIFGSKRGSQLSLALERLVELAGDFQRIGLSATIGDMDFVSKFLSGVGRNCEIVDIGGKKKYEISVEYPEPTAPDASLAKLLMVPKNVAYCMRRMKELIDSSRNCIIFTNTRQMAEVLGSRFKKWVPDYPIEVHHGSLSKEVRIDAENKFKGGELKAVIATSSLELGIDIGDVDIVIQYSSPRQITKLIQRVGRSAHTVSGISKGVVFCLDIDDYLEAKAIVDMLQIWIEKPNMPEKPFDVLCNQIMAFCLQEYDLTANRIFEVFKRAYPYRNLSKEDMDEILELMDELRLIFTRDGKVIKTRKAYKYFFENLSVIPDEKTFFVIDKELNKRIGILHQEFVVENLKLGAHFLMKGEAWRVVEMEDNKVFVHSVKEIEGAVPSWEGELIPVPMEIAEVVGKMRRKSRLLKQSFIPDNKNIVIEYAGPYVVMHSCFGSKVNQTIAKVLAAVVSSRIGTSIAVRTDPYRIIFRLPVFTRREIISEEFLKLKPEWIRGLLEQSLKNTSLFRYRFFHVAKRFSLLNKDAVFNTNRVQYLIDVMSDSPVVKETFNELFREKLDIEGTENVVKNLGKSVNLSDSDKPISPLGMVGLETSGMASFVQPKESFRELMEIIRERLLKKKFYFVCLHCNKPIGSFSVKNLPDLKCECGAKLIGFVPEKDKTVARKVVNKKKLSGDERRVMNYIKKTAELYLYYGNKAPFVLAAYGIGPETARRILSIGHVSEEELLMDIIDAERNFLRTRQFWN